MALRREGSSSDQRARQEALDFSWAETQRSLADPEFRAYLVESMRRIDAKDPAAPILTREEFLAQTEPSDG